MGKNKLVWLVAAAVLLVLAFVLWQKYYKTPAYQPPSPAAGTGTKTGAGTGTKGILPKAVSAAKTYTIEITSLGFKPNTLDIHSGDTVKFVNTDSRDHWPASGVHPTHQLCPGFDSYHGLIHNETYSYTFNFAAPKTCPFHDHREPAITGVINIVK